MRQTKAKNIKLLIGKLLVLISSFLGVHPFTIFVSIPLFIIGQFIIWKSNNINKKQKQLWLLIPVLTIPLIWILIIIITRFFY